MTTSHRFCRIARASLLVPVSAIALALPGMISARGAEVDPQKVVLLVERINDHERLIQDRKYAAAYDMLGSRWREGEEDRKESIRAGRKMDNGIKILDWRIKAIWIAGDRAKIHMATQVKNRETLFKWKEGVEEEDDFWIFENNNWYFIPLKVRDWDENQAVEVPVPRPPLKVEIKQK